MLAAVQAATHTAIDRNGALAPWRTALGRHTSLSPIALRLNRQPRSSRRWVGTCPTTRSLSEVSAGDPRRPQKTNGTGTQSLKSRSAWPRADYSSNGPHRLAAAAAGAVYVSFGTLDDGRTKIRYRYRNAMKRHPDAHATCAKPQLKTVAQLLRPRLQPYSGFSVIAP